MLDCILRIRSLNDREIEIHVDPGKQLHQDQNVPSELTDEHADQNIENPIESVQEDNEPKVVKGTTDEQLDHMELEPAKPDVSEKLVDTEPR